MTIIRESTSSFPTTATSCSARRSFGGIIITHGHEDHTGALPYLLKDLGMPVPVLGTKLTLGIIAGKLEEHRIKKPKLREIKAGSHLNLGMFSLDFFAVNHSIPDGVAVYVRTPVGTVLHTGDFKLDQTPMTGASPTSPASPARPKQGVTLMLSDSTGAEHPGHTPSRPRSASSSDVYSRPPSSASSWPRSPATCIASSRSATPRWPTAARSW